MSVLDLSNTNYLLLDIEGTICSILFVRDVLYPYFMERFESIMDQLSFPLIPVEPHSDIDLINNIVAQFPENDSKSVVISHIKELVANDVKDPILKSFQGFVWKLGYEKGDITAPIYPDAIKLIKQFTETKKIYIYSSGSVKAQKLLFNYVKDGDKVTDMNGYLSGYFDITTSGFKQELTSYTKILQDIGCKGEEVLFLSDNVKEVVAAKQANMRSVIVDRPGNNELTEEEILLHGVVTDFGEFRL